MLVNYSRNMAVLLDSLLPDDDSANRVFFARTLSNFAIVLKGHLRTGITIDELEETETGEREMLLHAKHVPSRTAALLMRRLQALKREHVSAKGDMITMRSYHQALLDITGSCERIKNTPIPFSYSFFIKLFITLYLLLMPLVLVETYHISPSWRLRLRVMRCWVWK